MMISDIIDFFCDSISQIWITNLNIFISKYITSSKGDDIGAIGVNRIIAEFFFRNENFEEEISENFILQDFHSVNPNPVIKIDSKGMLVKNFSLFIQYIL